MSVSPLLGIVRNAAPKAAGQTLPTVPELSDFSAVLTNLMELLKGLFDSPQAGAPRKDVSQELGLGPPTDLERVPGESAPHASAAPIRDFSSAREGVREGLRREIEERLEELPVENAAVQIEEIRRLVQQIDTRGMVGDDSGQPGTVVDEIMHAMADLKRQFSNPESAAPPPPVTPVEEPVEPPPAPPPPSSEGSALAKPPVTQESLEKILGVKVEELEVSEPAPEPAVRALNPVPVVPVAPALAAAVPAIPATPESGRSGAAPSNDVAPAPPRSPSEAASPARPERTPASRAHERVEFVERIVRAAKLSQTQGQTKMRIVLNPPHLGGLKVSLSVQDHVLRGTILAEQPAAREMILSHLNELKESLEEQGVQVGELQVSVGQGAEQSPRQSADGAGHAPSFRSIVPAEVRRADPEADDAGMRIRSARLQLIDLVA